MPSPRYAIVLVVGHSEASKGAHAVDGTPEWDFWRLRAEEIATRVSSDLGVDVLVRWRNRDEAGNAGHRALIKEVNTTGAALAVELHFNSGLPAWNSPEVLYWPSSSGGLRVATAMVNQLRRSRVKARMTAQEKSWNETEPAYNQFGDRIPNGPPLLFLRDTHMIGIIYEGFFGTNALDWERANKPEYLSEVVEAIKAGYRAV